MKALSLCALLLLFSTIGCGGYGAGMAMTPTPAPLITPPSGTYNGPQQMITITDSLPGATIYFTTDGTTPTLSSNVTAGRLPSFVQRKCRP